MIVAERKPISEIQEMVKDMDRILVLGCKGCVTVCNTGGLKEVQQLASVLKIGAKMEGRSVQVDEKALERQCDPEYNQQIKDIVDGYDAVLSMACGVGPQFLSEMYPHRRFFPAVNTTFMGGAIQHGMWVERCAGCGRCVIHNFDGMCPIARCSKSLMNGPCGGSNQGKCEIAKDVDCIWDMIVRKKMEQGRLEDLLHYVPVKDWSTSRHGGPRTSVREDLLE